MSKPKYIITNLCYGDTYSKLFTQNHLKSLLDPTNLPAIADKYEIEMTIFTDPDTERQLAFHPNMVKLSKICTISTSKFQLPAGVNKYNQRYSLILNMVKASIKQALDQNALLTCWVADLVVAQEFFPRVIKRMEDGHGAVFVVPLRSASEAVTPVLNKFHNALPDKDLCSVAMECLHPLWVACNWNNPQFTKLPFTLLWQGSGGLLARTFQPTPIIFRPTEAMLSERGMIDGDIPQHCVNPYWATDWTDAPVCGVEPLICYYPPFANRPSSTQFVADFAQNIHKTQIPFLSHHMYYPSKADVDVRPELLEQSDRVVSEIQAAHG